MDDGKIVLDGSTREIFYQLDILNKVMIKTPQIVLLKEALKDYGSSGKPTIIEEFIDKLSKLLRKHT